MSKKIAIVGAGISGLGAAWMLHQSGFEVTVYEAEPFVGGHMETFECQLQTENIRFDSYPGNLMTSHNLLTLCDIWNIPFQKYPFGIYYDNGDKSWGTYDHTPFFHKHAEECRRFTSLLKELYEQDAAVEATAASFQDFLNNNGFSGEFVHHILWPVLAPMINVRIVELMQFSPASFAEVFAQGIFSFFDSTTLCHFPNGMWDILSHFTHALEHRVRTNTAVTNIVREEDAVHIFDSNGGHESFDEVVLSTNFRHNRRFLEKMSVMEENIFNGIEYKDDYLLIHSDVNSMPARFFQDDQVGCFVDTHGITNPVIPHGAVSNRRKDVMVTAYTGGDNPVTLSDEMIHIKRHFLVEMITGDSLLAKSNICHIQGQNHTWYCGLSTVPGLSECCLVSGFAVAERLGATYPFSERQQANTVFENIKNIMFHTRPSLHLFF